MVTTGLGAKNEKILTETNRPLRILHTSDWHIGVTLYGKRRLEEFDHFFQWLLEILEDEQIDVLLVSGDIFDSAAPSGAALELYYDILRKASCRGKRHVVVISGNHDSASMLQAPRPVLECINVHVAGMIRDDPADDIIAIEGDGGLPRVVICAVPFLRSRDIRTSEAGETDEERNRKQRDGIVEYYNKIAQLARQKYPAAGKSIPLVGMGHLFVSSCLPGDSEKTRGLLHHVDPDGLYGLFDYFALGHLHVPQTSGGCENIQYSGSPIPISFGDCKMNKHVCIVEFEGCQPNVRYVEVPVFQELITIRGDWNTIENRLEELRQSGSCAWLEIMYEGNALTDLDDRVDAATKSMTTEVLRVHDGSNNETDLWSELPAKMLCELDPETIFLQLLDEKNVDISQRDELMSTYREILTELDEHDPYEKE